MAFNAPVSLQNIASAAGELWPSISTAMHAPWRSLGRRTPLSSTEAQKASSARVAQKDDGVKPARQPSSALPECLASAPLSTLGHRASAGALRSMHTAAGIFSQVPSDALRQCSPLAHTLPTFSTSPRQYSTLARFGSIHLRPVPRPLGLAQHRTYTNISRNMLAHLEQTANNNPQSATAQNAFYSALQRAGLNQIIVERYQTGRFATNQGCDNLYTRAVEMVGQAEKGDAMAGNTTGGGLGSDQMQSVAQAVAARFRGGNVATARKNGSGDKASPLYVVVDETTGSMLFKWLKFFFWFGMATWFCIIVIQLFIEATGMLKKVGGTQNNEARPELQTTRFSDVHGCDEAKEELQELVDFLKNPNEFNALGGKLPKGVLLVGPPGTGKTLLSRAVAGEAGVPFFYMSGSEFDEVYVGVGAKRVRELFGAAKSKAPAIVFIDELDAIGGKRSERDVSYAKQTLNQLLTELDGFDQNSGVIFLAATNFPQMLDKALTRPGRFDRNVTVPLPDVRGRAAILGHHMRKITMGPDVDPLVIARGTPGFSGAELENIVNQAAVRASKTKKKVVSMIEVEWAKDKTMMGAERRSAVIQEKDRIATAYHEGGHALIALFNKSTDPLYKATIMPRGHALGITYQLPEMDRVSMTKREYMARIDVCMGGKVAEELVYGPDEVTSGASNDIQQATSIAYSMVTQCGMSNDLGNVDLYSNFERLSSETKNKIEDEVRRILEDSRKRAHDLLTSKRVELDRLAKGLVEFETLNKAEIEKIVRGEKLPDKLKSDAVIPIKLPEVVIPSIPGSGGQQPPPPGPGAGIPGAGRDESRDESRNESKDESRDER